MSVHGHVKLQGIDLPYGRQLIPQYLYIGNKVWRPCSILPTLVHKFSETRKVARIGFESDMNQPCWINIDTEAYNIIHHYPDGSALYECLIEDEENLHASSSFDHSDFKLRLLHHTKSEIVPAIFNSNELRASRSNYEGSYYHDELSFIYFTDLEALNTPEDLLRVAMSDEGRVLALEYDQPEFVKEELNIPTRSKGTMDAFIEVFIDPWLIDPQPMLFHDQRIRNEGTAQYWELLHQNIFRIPVELGGVIQITEQQQVITDSDVSGLHIPDRILAGCAFRKGELRVVFDENANSGYRVNRATDINNNPLEIFFSD